MTDEFRIVERTPEDGEELRRRQDILESENARLRRQLKTLGLIPDNPNFDSRAFQKALAFYQLLTMAPFGLMMGGFILLAMRMFAVPKIMIGPLPLVDPGGYFGNPGMGLGIVAIGGLSFGLIAVGGMAVGVIAMGGGAIGIVSIGGGSLGLIAFGGGAVGLIAMGGGAFGYYALCANGAGKHVFSLKRQDAKAVAFWTRIFPRFKNAIAGPMPVVVVENDDGFKVM